MITIQTHGFVLTKFTDFNPHLKFHPQIAQAEYIGTSQLENLPRVTVLESKYFKCSEGAA